MRLAMHSQDGDVLLLKETSLVKRFIPAKPFPNVPIQVPTHGVEQL